MEWAKVLSRRRLLGTLRCGEGEMHQGASRLKRENERIAVYPYPNRQGGPDAGCSVRRMSYHQVQGAGHNMFC
jgi:hypothetical protein